MLSIIGGTAAITIAGIVILYISTTQPLITPDEKLRILANVCKNPEFINDRSSTLVICQHPANSTENHIFNLPLPVYKITPCVSTFGCFGPYWYIPQIPEDLLTPQQKQQVIDRVLQATGLKDRYPDIQLDHLFVEPREDNWFADVQFIIPHIMNGYGNCGWYTAAQIDLQTFEVYPNGVAVGNQKC